MSSMTLFWKIDQFNRNIWVLVTWVNFPKYPHPFRFSARVSSTLFPLSGHLRRKTRNSLSGHRRCPSQLIVGARHTPGFGPVLGISVGDFSSSVFGLVHFLFSCPDLLITHSVLALERRVRRFFTPVLQGVSAMWLVSPKIV